MPDTWYQYPLIGGYGEKDPYFNGPKPDINVAVPPGIPITDLASGVVSGIESPSGATPSWGHAITVRLDNPPSQEDTHIAYLHLQSIPSSLRVGQHINPGDVLGVSGGTNPGNGLQQASVGVAYYGGDYYGFGPAWANEGKPETNIMPFLQQIRLSGTPNDTINLPFGVSIPNPLAGVTQDVSLIENALQTAFLRVAMGLAGIGLIFVGMMLEVL